MRKQSIVAPGWWDYTTLDETLLSDVARLSEKDLAQLSRTGFQVVFKETLEDFYLAEALEYMKPGAHPPRTTLQAFAVPSALRNNCHWSQDW